MGMIRLQRRPDGVAMVILDHPDKPVNTLTPSVVEEFNQKVMPLLDENDVRAFVVVSAKPDTFVAGADLEIETSESVSEGQFNQFALPTSDA